MRDKKHVRDTLAGVFAIVILYGSMQLFGITCPIKYVTGVSCAGCGMTRAWMSLVFHGDLAGAFCYHPLFWLVIPTILWLVFKPKIPKKLYKAGILVVIILAVAVYLIRMFSPADEIVVFRPGEGLIGKVILHILKRMSIL